MSKPGDSLKHIFENTLLDLKGTELTIYKNWGKEEMTSIASKAIKESANKFEFPIDTDIEKNDVIQINDSRSFWRVEDIDEDVEFGTPINLAVRVVKIDQLGNKISINSQGKAIFHGPIHGNVQIDGQNNTQNLTITNTINNPEFNSAIQSITELVKASTLNKYQKEDLISDLQRIEQLAKEKPTPELVEHAKSKILTLDNAIKGTELAVKVGQHIPTILNFFQGFGF